MGKIKPGALRVEQVLLSALKLDARNPRLHGDRQINQIARSIAAFGFVVPALIDRDSKVLAGHGRIHAAKKLGLAEIPIIRLEHLTPEQARAYEALSEPQRNAVNEWYDHSLLSRLNDKAHGCIVVIMQRLHQDDLVGHVLAQEDWEVLSLPAIAEEDEAHWIEDVFGRRQFSRRAGEPLHPERDSVHTLEQLRRTHGEYVFASQYQQNPISMAGIMVRRHWLHHYSPDQLPERPDEIVQSWDTANKVTELSDFSVCTTWAVYDERYYLVDVYRERLEYPALRRKVCELAQLHKADTVVIEDNASGTQLIQDLNEDGVRGVAASTAPPSHDKVMQLYAQTAVFENGSVLLPQDAPWLRDYINELTAFPAVKARRSGRFEHPGPPLHAQRKLVHADVATSRR